LPEPVGPAETHGRWVHLWLCDNGWHAQITSAAAGDSVWLTSAAGTDFGHATVRAGSTTADSATVGQTGRVFRRRDEELHQPVRRPGRPVCVHGGTELTLPIGGHMFPSVRY
jgi:hypothetical protein